VVAIPLTASRPAPFGTLLRHPDPSANSLPVHRSPAADDCQATALRAILPGDQAAMFLHIVRRLIGDLTTNFSFLKSDTRLPLPG